ncbi:outer membrane beta-barrel protein [Pedobacter metabolipauper]|uniref:Outer membrane protein with beta-barrel domain n=1 Tax=Pedobacter metabolipauper TaxID=425513 RepID=A0A4R6SXI0_9SPHI|nr:outer membrane beta-barrel protein [Pedobacter metabolipauper]TDQ09412.1 outer membrane protein with beta-barrel domain [Pedobacter metabolipauper]
MKTTYISLLAILLCFNVSAQSNFYKFSIGGGFGATRSYTDVEKSDYGIAGHGNLDYYLTPFISLGGELQAGQINGGDTDTDPYGRQFINSFRAGSLNLKIYMGALFNDNRSSNFANAMKWLYVGGGAGLVQNKLIGIIRYQSNGDMIPGKTHSRDLLVPLNIGYSYYFSDYAGRPKFAINLNYQANITIGEGLDGYDYSAVNFKSGRPDVYTFLTLGIKYHFGTLGLSRKSF